MYRWEMDQLPILTSPNSPGGVAPFVMKTYQMVSDPATDHLISWGRANNSFIVLDPLLFSHLVLPSNFKHSNFSSFIRQLNTYGFRKVDPDRWEFANEWFLRGQKQLLKNIVRKKSNPGQMSNHQEVVIAGGEAEEEMEIELERMRLEQEEMDKELQGMTRRLETTERRPEQMMEFLCKVVDDPEILPKMMLERERRTRQRQICPGSDDGGGAKKRRLIMSAPSPPSVGATATASNSARTEEEEGSNSLGVASSSSEVDTSWFGGGEVGYGGGSGGFVGFICDAPAVGLGFELEAIAPPYPFSLLGGDF